MIHTDGPELLARWMERNGFGQRQLARAAEIHQPSIQRFLNGKGLKRFSVKHARILAGMTGIPVEKLIRRIPTPTSEQPFKTSESD